MILILVYQTNSIKTHFVALVINEKEKLFVFVLYNGYIFNLKEIQT